MHSATAIDYTQGQRPDEAYEQFKANWNPPVKSPAALYGRVIVEFTPYAHKSESGLIFTPEKASFQAIVVDDSTGELPPGTEVVLESLDGQNFKHEGRILCCVQKDGILGIIE